MDGCCDCLRSRFYLSCQIADPCMPMRCTVPIDLIAGLVEKKLKMEEDDNEDESVPTKRRRQDDELPAHVSVTKYHSPNCSRTDLYTHLWPVIRGECIQMPCRGSVCACIRNPHEWPCECRAKKEKLKKALKKKRKEVDLDANEQAQSSTAFGAVRKAEHDWDFEENEAATDDEEGADLSDVDQEHPSDEEDVEDSEEEDDDANLLTGFGEVSLSTHSIYIHIRHRDICILYMCYAFKVHSFTCTIGAEFEPDAGASERKGCRR